MSKYNCECNFELAYNDALEIKNEISFKKDFAEFSVFANNKKVKFVINEDIELEKCKMKAEKYLKDWIDYVLLIDKDLILDYKFLNASKKLENGKTQHLSHENLLCHLEVVKPKNKIPEFPDDFFMDETVEILSLRYRELIKGEEKLISFAYFIKTVLEDMRFGNKDLKGKKYYKISNNLINEIGKLAGKHGKGEPLKARTAAENGFNKLTNEEHDWLEKAVPKIILHMGKIAYYKSKKLDLPDKLNISDIG